MNHTDVAILTVNAAIAAGLVLYAVVRRSRNLDEGLQRARLGLNIVTLMFYRGVWALAFGLLLIGWYRKDYDLWYIAAAVVIVGMMLFRDLSASHSNPFSEWFSRTPMSDRVRRMEEESARLSEELTRGEGTGRTGDAERDESSRFREEFRKAARKAATPEESVDEAGRKTRSFTFSFQWPPKSRDS